MDRIVHTCEKRKANLGLLSLSVPYGRGREIAFILLLQQIQYWCSAFWCMKGNLTLQALYSVIFLKRPLPTKSVCKPVLLEVAVQYKCLLPKRKCLQDPDLLRIVLHTDLYDHSFTINPYLLRETGGLVSFMSTKDSKARPLHNWFVSYILQGVVYFIELLDYPSALLLRRCLTKTQIYLTA